MRIHLAIIAQAASTSATMMPGRFFLGVGTGENLNEHILGDRWPAHDMREAMLEEAVAIIRTLWQGNTVTYRGEYYTVENARIHTLPAQLPPILMAASGPQAAECAGRIADGLITTTPDAELLKRFEAAGGSGKSSYGQLTVCWAQDQASARRIAYQYWPTAAVRGELTQELPTPAHFEQAAKMVHEEDVSQAIICGKDDDQGGGIYSHGEHHGISSEYRSWRRRSAQTVGGHPSAFAGSRPCTGAFGGIERP